MVSTPAPPEPSDSCLATLGPPPSCETADKPQSLTFRYTGAGCSASENDQGGKFECSGVPGAGTVGISIVKDPGKITLSDANVGLGDLTTVSAIGGDMGSEIQLQVGGQLLTIHTSCSAPLAVGDVFGSLELVEFDGKGADVQVTYFYDVFNNGDPLAAVRVTDDKLGDIAGPFALASGESRRFTRQARISATTTNTALAQGTLNDGSPCSAEDTVTVAVDVVEPCAVCKGGVTELTFRYLGLSTVMATVYDSSSIDPGKTLFSGTLAPGEEFTVVPRPGQDKLSSDISIYVNGAFNAKVHTSCSQPIGPNAVYGDFEVVAGRSKDNGAMCPLNPCAPSAASSLVLHDKELRWDTTNNGDLGLEIRRIVISWPSAAGSLVEIKRDGDTFHKGDFPPASAVIDSGWEGDANKRTIKPGETDTLKFKFERDVETIAGPLLDPDRVCRSQLLNND